MESDSAKRKATPLYSGVLSYFPDALCAVARLSKYGNEKHHPGKKTLQWSRETSADHLDCIARHLLDYARVDRGSGEYHMAAVAWRALAVLQLLEEERSDTE
jgi:hypothetical protein